MTSVTGFNGDPMAFLNSGRGLAEKENRMCNGWSLIIRIEVELTRNMCLRSQDVSANVLATSLWPVVTGQ